MTDARTSLVPSQHSPTTASQSFAGEQRWDVCIVGGGFTVYRPALELAKAGRTVVPCWKQKALGLGVFGARNGGQINPGLAADHAAGKNNWC